MSGTAGLLPLVIPSVILPPTPDPDNGPIITPDSTSIPKLGASGIVTSVITYTPAMNVIGTEVNPDNGLPCGDVTVGGTNPGWINILTQGLVGGLWNITIGQNWVVKPDPIDGPFTFPVPYGWYDGYTANILLINEVGTNVTWPTSFLFSLDSGANIGTTTHQHTLVTGVYRALVGKFMCSHPVIFNYYDTNIEP